MSDPTLFQYCQKIVLLSPDLKKVLLAKRREEQDYDGVYSFIGGKMVVTDKTIVDSIKREKDEEIGNGAQILIIPDETHNVLFRKKDGNSMILPHIAAIFDGGTIKLNDEYSDYQWVDLSELVNFKPKIENIPKLVEWARSKLQNASPKDFVEI